MIFLFFFCFVVFSVSSVASFSGGMMCFFQETVFLVLLLVGVVGRARYFGARLFETSAGCCSQGLSLLAIFFVSRWIRSFGRGKCLLDFLPPWSSANGTNAERYDFVRAHT